MVYVFVYNLTESFDGVKYQVGILSVNGNWIVPMTATNPILTSGADCSAKVFQEKILYAGDGCILVPIDKDNYSFDYFIYNIKENKIAFFDMDNPLWYMDYLVSIINFNSNGRFYTKYNDYMHEFHTDGSIKQYSYLPEGQNSTNSYGSVAFYV